MWFIYFGGLMRWTTLWIEEYYGWICHYNNILFPGAQFLAKEDWGHLNHQEARSEPKENTAHLFY